ncbi:hypothetical protein [Roseateles amylovorans]|uniref:Uncharacterized protein n=1 Tax=Roseateles amylovorans TaxID=2978473 RepID=A0ABY6AZP8_9BURK|nr:hypothetical protein [Roseateles amylovorans]UXH77889.1 hypothetical protein N4261_23440 [Roseateles amylovorans]
MPSFTTPSLPLPIPATDLPHGEPPPLPLRPPAGYGETSQTLTDQLSGRLGTVADLRTIPSSRMQEVSCDQLDWQVISQNLTQLLLPPQCPPILIDYLIRHMPALEVLSAPDQRQDNNLLIDLRPAHRLRLYHTTYDSALPISGSVPMLISPLEDCWPRAASQRLSQRQGDTIAGGRGATGHDADAQALHHWPLCLLDHLDRNGCRLVLADEADFKVCHDRLRFMKDQSDKAVQTHAQLSAARRASPAPQYRMKDEDIRDLRRALMHVPYELLPKRDSTTVQRLLRHLDQALDNRHVSLGNDGIKRIQELLQVQKVQAKALMNAQPWRERPVTIFEKKRKEQFDAMARARSLGRPVPLPRTVFLDRTSSGRLQQRTTEIRPTSRHRASDASPDVGTSAHSPSEHP